MKKIHFGFVIESFDVALTANRILVPGSSKGTLKRSMMRYGSMNDSAGLYTLTLKHDGSVVCDMPVHVMWCGHEKEPQPFLGFKPDHPKKMQLALAVYKGKRVELEFTPRQ